MTKNEHQRPTPAPGRGGFPAGQETGWLPDLVFTGGRFESGLAFFADERGRVSRFSREPGDLAMAKRLGGQAALPGLVIAHAQSWRRVLRGRTCAPSAPNEAPRLSAEDVYDSARLAFVEMLLSGVTCAGEFSELAPPPELAAASSPDVFNHAIVRAARDVGIRIALLKILGGNRETASPGAAPGEFIREVQALRAHLADEHPGDDAWIGIGTVDPSAVSLEDLRAVVAHAHAQRLRVQIPVSGRPADNDACVARHGRSPVAFLMDHGLIDKRVSLVHATHISPGEAAMIGSARAMVCICPEAALGTDTGLAPVGKLLAAGAAVALGTECSLRVDLLEDARTLEQRIRTHAQEGGFGEAGRAEALFHAATVAGARSLGAPGGSLEVGRPADFFTVNLYDPSLAGAQPDSLLESVVYSLQRRALREVWVGARQRLSGGRHPLQGPIVARFVELQRRLWGAGQV